MSKRFGRNQKRRAREALADREERIQKLGSALDMNRGLSKHLTEKLRYLQRILEDATMMAGEMSVLFPATHVEFGGGVRNHFDMPVRSGNSFDIDCLGGIDSLTMEIQRLPVMLARIDKRALDRAIHITLEFKDRSIGYAISGSSLMVRKGQIMERELLRVLSKMIDQRLFGSRL